MADCSNVEIRELLPERAGSALSAADHARVDAHLASCPTCSAELALIQAARRAIRVTPSIDVGRISAAVVAATVTPSRPQLVTSAPMIARAQRAPRMRWIGLKAAAAVAIAAAGIGSFAVWRSADDGASLPNGGSARPVAAATPAPAASAPSPGAAGSPAPLTVASATPASSASAEIGVAGGLSDLSASDLKALLGDLGTTGVADDAAFEEPAPVIPDVGDIGGGESL